MCDAANKLPPIVSFAALALDVINNSLTSNVVATERPTFSRTTTTLAGMADSLKQIVGDGGTLCAVRSKFSPIDAVSENDVSVRTGQPWMTTNVIGMTVVL